MDDARVMVEKYIDDAVMAGLEKINIIHGRGNLQRTVAGLAKGCCKVGATFVQPEKSLSLTLGDCESASHGLFAADLRQQPVAAPAAADGR